MRSVIELCLEMSPGEGGVAHVPDLPGCHFRGSSREDILARGAAEVGRYLEWCEAWGLGDLGPHVAALVKARRRAISASGPALVVRVVEEKPGETPWLSGGPSALFEKDREPLADPDVHAHFRVVRAVYQDMARELASLTPEEIAEKAESAGRSLAETLDHVARCVWWYCSRLDDGLPEPGEECPPAGLARVQCSIPFAEKWLLQFPAERRGEVIVPTRFLTRDPQEPWTHRKACRRQAEHMVEHLRGIWARGRGLAARRERAAE